MKGTICWLIGLFPDCVAEGIVVELANLPAAAGMHSLQIENPDGLFINDFIFHTSEPGWQRRRPVMRPSDR